MTISAQTERAAARMARPLLLVSALMAGFPAFALTSSAPVAAPLAGTAAPAPLVASIASAGLTATATAATSTPAEAAGASDSTPGAQDGAELAAVETASTGAEAGADGEPDADADTKTEEWLESELDAEPGATAQEPAAAGQAGQAAQAASDGASAAGPRVRNRLDPWESWNRKVFRFNEKLDENVLRPVATAYSELVPTPARQAVDNFFGNFSDAWSAVNLFLQGRFKTGAQQTMRVAVNSVFGIAGLIDIATPAGLEKNSEDLGRTLGWYGVKTGPYIVWPLLGPSSLRDSVVLPVNTYYSPAYLFDDGEYKFAISALQIINTRANLLRVTDMLDGIALDKYTFVRDAYLQRRNVKKRNEAKADEEDDYEVITPETPAAAPAR